MTQIAEQLNSWARRAHYAISESDTKIEIFSDPGGEIVYHIRRAEGGYTIHSTERSSDEYFELSTEIEQVVVKYLALELGGSIRILEGIGLLSVPSKRQDLPAGYELDTAGDFDVLRRGTERVGLFAPGDEKYPAVRYAQVDSSSLEVIESSISDAIGAPLFSR